MSLEEQSFSILSCLWNMADVTILIFVNKFLYSFAYFDITIYICSLALW